MDSTLGVLKYRKSAKVIIMAVKPKPLEVPTSDLPIEKLSLSVEASKSFVEALSDNSEPNSAMKKAAKLYKEIMSA